MSSVMNKNAFRGIVTYLDGGCNTLAGKDHSKLYMENLACRRVDAEYGIGPVYSSKTVNGGNVAHSWSGDYLVLGSAMGFPISYYDDFTYEAVLKTTTTQPLDLWNMENTTTVKDGPHVELSFKDISINITYNIDSYTTSGGHEMDTDSDVLPNNVPFHLLIVHKMNEYVRIYVNGSKVLENTNIPTQYTSAKGYTVGYPGSKEQGVNNQSFYKYLMGIGGSNFATQHNDMGGPWAGYDGLSIALLKVYNYPLTTSEITENYNYCANRFNL